MSFVKETNKESVKFSGIPLYIKDHILQKMNFKTYGTYMMTGKEAGALSARNDQFFYSMPIYKMTIKNGHVSFMDGLQIKVITFEMCEKMKLRPQIVAVQDVSLNIKTCDFLLKLEEIPTFECSFLKGGVPHIAEFFKKAKIQTLKMSMVVYVEEFDYDTSRIEKVEIHNKKLFTPLDIFSIKARSSLSLNSMHIRPEQIYRHFLEFVNEPKKPDLILNNCDIEKDQWLEIMSFFYRNFTSKGQSTFILNGEPSVKIDILSLTYPYSLKIQVLGRKYCFL